MVAMDEDTLLNAPWWTAVRYLSDARREAHRDDVVEAREARRVRPKTCIVAACERDTKSWGLCPGHYMHMRRAYFARPSRVVNADNQERFVAEWAPSAKPLRSRMLSTSEANRRRRARRIER